MALHSQWYQHIPSLALTLRRSDQLANTGDADVMLAGGAEGSIDLVSLNGFCRLKALSTRYNDDPARASRPFDRGRDGFVMGEGAGVLILEELGHAVARGAYPYAEVRGYGLSGDAHHITKPAADGIGARRAMMMALSHAGIPPEAVDYINAHATSTPLGDEIECRAIVDLFGRHATSGHVAVSSTKGAIGHLLGAAGAVEAAFAVLAVNQDVCPPNVNLEKTDDTVVGNYIAGQSLRKSVGAAISNSFGFGGTNASLVFAKAPVT
eukprot:scaffold1006_cov408-Prasinococcus_capsulatus_cf.AAC.7